MKLIERFNAKWKYTPGCWLWTAAQGSAGYGHMVANRKMVGAHRLSHEIHIGPIPGGLQVLHRCDVRACVNPDHLFLGTHADNMADKKKKGRDAKGEDHGSAKLTASKVMQIRASTMTLSELAKLYGVSIPSVCGIKSRKYWSHIS